MGDEEKDRLLREIHAYTRAIAASALRDQAKEVIDDYEKALVYSKLDGTKTDERIHDLTGVPRRTITDWVKLFVENGLAIAFGRSERALFTLEELRIDVATLKKEREKRGGK